MEKIELAASSRELTGKKVKNLRTEGLVPGVLYGNKVESAHVSVGLRSLVKAYAIAGSNQILHLSVDDGKPYNVMIQDLQTDSRSGLPVHVDFYRIKMDEKIKTQVPLHFVGESTAVYKLEGSLIHNLESVEVEALPGNLPENIEVDISVLDDFDKSIHVSDLAIPTNVELLTDDSELVAKVDPPRSDEELEALDEAIVEEVPGDEDGEASEDKEGEATEGDAKSDEESEKE